MKGTINYVNPLGRDMLVKSLAFVVLTDRHVVVVVVMEAARW